MDTIIFGLILAALGTIIMDKRRPVVIAAFAVALAAVLLLFKHHVTSDLPLNF